MIKTTLISNSIENGCVLATATTAPPSIPTLSATVTISVKLCLNSW